MRNNEAAGQSNISLLARLSFLRDLKIGHKLIFGFGVLVLITLVVVGLSYFGSTTATEKINTTSEVRSPTALTASRAQANLLRMLSDVRGYLALGEPTFRESYQQNRDAFATDLANLKRLSVNFSSQDKERLDQLEATFEEWSDIPEKLFDLRDDRLEREPAYRLLATEGSLWAGNILIDINTLILAQAERNPTPRNMELLGDMAKFQGTFASMFSALRGYVTTRNRIFRQEYEVNLVANNFAWERLLNSFEALEANQQLKIQDIKLNRRQFITLPSQIFERLESDQWRQDLYLFKTETVPRAERMQTLLNELTKNQQELLQTDLRDGRDQLADSNEQTFFLGFGTLILGVVFALIFRELIAGPVVRLTWVAERIRDDDLAAQATVESKDEIGILAETFNNMTRKLRETLFQVRKEKKRADDLLEVVIPIGVELSSEKNFNRLLEKMLVEAKTFCQADAGTLYLRTPNDELEAVIVQNNSLGITMGGTSGNKITVPNLSLKDKTTGEPNYNSITTYTVLTGNSVNVADRYQDARFQDTQSKIFASSPKYRAVSYLSLPLKNNEGEAIGAMQLINAQDPQTGEIIPFDENIQQMMESFSSLAVAALEAYRREQSLRQEIKQLRIQIDETKRQQAVKAIVESDSFADLQAKAQSMRRRRKRQSQQTDDD